MSWRPDFEWPALRKPSSTTAFRNRPGRAPGAAGQGQGAGRSRQGKGRRAGRRAAGHRQGARRAPAQRAEEKRLAAVEAEKRRAGRGRGAQEGRGRSPSGRRSSEGRRSAAHDAAAGRTESRAAMRVMRPAKNAAKRRPVDRARSFASVSASRCSRARARCRGRSCSGHKIPRPALLFEIAFAMVRRHRG